MSNVATQYDALGQVLRVSRPHFDGQSPYWTEYGNDVIGRVISQSSLATGTTITQYSELSTIVTNDKGQKTK